MNRWIKSGTLSFVLATVGACAQAPTPAAADRAPAADAARIAEVTAAAESDPQRSQNGAAFQLFQNATALEAEGKRPQAIDIYIRSARGGNCFAAVRLGQIYDGGTAGVTADLAESSKWTNFARTLGCGSSFAAPGMATKPSPLPSPTITATSSAQFRAAVGLESSGQTGAAVKAYAEAARSQRDCESARRLAQIYEHGIVDYPRDYGESLKWYNAARVMGCEVPIAKSQ